MAELTTATAASPGPTTTVRRPARAARPVVPSSDLVVKAPPRLPQPEDGNLWMTALPALSGLGSVLYMLTMDRGPIGYVVGTLFLVSCLAMVVGSVLRQRGSAKSQARNERREYLRYLERTRADVRRTAAAQREALEWDAPHPGVLWGVAASRRLWERRGSDGDFGVVRVGTGPRWLATPLVPGESAPVEDLDPLSSVALRRFLDTHAVVPELPVQVALRRFASVAFTCRHDPAVARALVRAVVAHAVAFHSPRDLRLVVCAGDIEGEAWGWAKWLPHAHHPEELDHAGPVRMAHPDLATLEDWLGAELTRRARFHRDAEPDPDLPHLLVVLDGGRRTGGEALLDPGGMQAVTVLDVDGTADALTEAHGVRLDVDEDGALHVVAGETRDRLGAADGLSPAEADALARQLARYRVDTAGPAADAEDLTTAVNTLPALLGIPDPGALDLDTLWRQRPMRDRLQVPIGVSADGGLLKLDIKESAQNGMGPHGLLVGATGSGKSELLRTLVLGMAATHSPEQLNFVLVDFKGGATFAGMAELPHVAAVITNLEDDLTLVDRMREALSGEMNRRQEVLRDAGNLVSVRDHERARQRGADLPPLPSLFIVVDEFSELLAQKPDFADLFVQIGRLGRSLGLHLLLASQRLDEGRLRGLEAHLSYRIGLRTFSEGESRTAIGVPDAHHLPNAPGHGYLRTDTATLKRFRAAYVSGPYRTGEGEAGAALGGSLAVRPFPASYVPVPAEQRAPQSERDAERDAEPQREPDEFGEGEDLGSTVLGVIVEQLGGQGPSAHQVWLPPLGAPESLDAVHGDLAVRPGRGLSTAPTRPPLTAVIGTVDRPFHQRRDPFTLDLSGAGGHVAIVGGPHSGKSTAVRSLIASLALRHTPDEVQFYCLDFSGALFGLGKLAHVGGVAGRLDAETVNRTVAEVLEVLESRESRFRELGVESMADYRRARAEGLAADDFGDVFLVVDGWGVLRQSYPEIEATLMAVAGRMLTYGIHLVITGNRWLDMRMAMRDLVGTKVELKLGDALDSEVDRKTQRTVPAGRPGRGITADRLHFLTAVPRVDGRHSDAGLADGVADLVARVNAAWQGRPAPRVRLLPPSFPVTEVAERDLARGITVGLEGNRLEPVVFTPGQDAGMIVIGDSESGKTSLLRAVARQVVHAFPPERAKLILLDHRMTLLREFDGPSLLGYSTTHERSAEVIGGVAQGLKKRLPGADVTPEQLRDRSWWSGPEIYLLIDDYDLVATSAGNPLRALVDFLPQARAIGLHLFITRQAGGAARAVNDPVLGRLKELNFPAVLLSVPKDEMPIWGVKSAKRAKGRGLLLHRRLGTVPAQLVRADSPLATSDRSQDPS
ncbi:type VII secretion protein EccCa [Streptomyces radicis]|uniref:Type VII secretion protein EccCa n=1 Tax=Streptomyces radicis TaxID=1750517 RepID=A0A3A9WND4_9ACTN|nr:type VII secretion protein EccCa [Streptomyces radicis]RKN10974.1 type VII secretion protein EccCa [Streptomyces radicis]RKN25237.1 type VII secretion protein EccCa [Streptomyces radicis]